MVASANCDSNPRLAIIELGPMLNLAVSAEVNDNAKGAKDLEFDFRIGENGRAARELCCPGAEPRRWIPPLVTRFSVIAQV